MNIYTDMRIVYMKEKVEIKNFLYCHNINEFDLLKFVNNAVDGKFTIDDITYRVELLNTKSYSIWDYSVSKDGKTFNNLTATMVCEMIDRNSNSLFSAHELKGNDIIINGFNVVRTKITKEKKKKSKPKPRYLYSCTDGLESHRDRSLKEVSFITGMATSYVIEKTKRKGNDIEFRNWRIKRHVIRKRK